MEVKGMAVGFIDVPQEHTEAYNYWYDFDHLAENLALPEICGARRYVATPDCKAVRDCRFPPLDGGQGTYFTSYLINTDDLDAAGESWHRLGTDLRKKRRFFRHGNVPYGGIYRLKKTLLSPSVPPVVSGGGPLARASGCPRRALAGARPIDAGRRRGVVRAGPRPRRAGDSGHGVGDALLALCSGEGRARRGLGA